MAIIFVVALLAIVVLPQFWVRFTIDRHGVERADLQGTGGDLARWIRLLR